MPYEHWHILFVAPDRAGADRFVEDVRERRRCGLHGWTGPHDPRIEQTCSWCGPWRVADLEISEWSVETGGEIDPVSTQRERLIELLTEFGITPTPMGAWHSEVTPLNVVLTADVGGVDGYHGFYVAFAFDDSGQFIDVGIWE
jgi:hypothetical protein